MKSLARALLGVAVACQAGEGGRLEVPAHELPLSAALSPEALAYYSGTPLAPPPMPALGEAKTQEAYDEGLRRFMALVEEQYVGPLARTALATWPMEIETTKLGGVPVERYTPKSGLAAGNEHRVLINLRSATYGAIGSNQVNRLHSVPVAGTGGVRVVSLLYREGTKRFPAAAQDALDVYRALLEQYPAQNIGLYGCSAGGMNVAHTMARIIDRQLPVPGAIGLLGTTIPHPPGSRTGDSDYFPVPTSRDLLVDDRGGLYGSFGYLGSGDFRDPLFNPLVSPAMLARFPPTLLITATRDRFSGTLEIHRALDRAGVEASLHVFDGLPHCFQVQTVLPESREAIGLIWRHFDRHLGR